MSRLIRDNKNILNLLSNKAYPYEDTVVLMLVFIIILVKD